MLNFICMGPVELPEARNKLKLQNETFLCPQWDLNPYQQPQLTSQPSYPSIHNSIYMTKEFKVYNMPLFSTSRSIDNLFYLNMCVSHQHGMHYRVFHLYKKVFLKQT